MDTNMTNTMKTWLRDSSEDDVRKALADALAALEKEKNEDPVEACREEIMNTWNKRRASGEDIDETDVAAIMGYYFADTLDDVGELHSLIEDTAEKTRETKEMLGKASKFFNMLTSKLGHLSDENAPCCNCSKSEESDEDIIDEFLKMFH